jgi:hypothetical protein
MPGRKPTSQVHLIFQFLSVTSVLGDSNCVFKIRLNFASQFVQK